MKQETIEQEKFDKLPKWAQSHIRTVERDADTLRRILETKFSEEKGKMESWEGYVFFEPYVDGETTTPRMSERVINAQTISLRTSDGVEVSIRARGGSVMVDIGYGVIAPCARNCIEILPEPQ